MKRFTLFFMLVCLSMPLFATKALNDKSLQSADTKKKENPKKEEKDSAPLIVAHILQSILPHLINAGVLTQNEDQEENTAIAQEVIGAMQGTANLILDLHKAIKRNPDLTPELCLLAYLRSDQGKLFLSKHHRALLK